MKGAFHRVTRLPKNLVINQFVGKEYHFRAERVQDANGKYHTHISAVRTTAPLYKQPGILHHLTAQSRRFEGDFNKLSVTQKLERLQPTTLQGKLALTTAKGLNNTRKFATRNMTRVALMTETAVVTTGSYAFRKARQKIDNEIDNVDTGKIVVKTATALSSLNNLRKTLYTHNVKKAYLTQKKSTLQAEKTRKKALKSNYQKTKKTTKLKLKQQQARLRQVGRLYNPSKKVTISKIKQRKRVNYNLNAPNRQLKNQKQLFVNQKKLVRYTRREKWHYYQIPLSLKAVGSTVKKPTSFIINKSSAYAQDNDFVTGLNSMKNGIDTIKRTGKQIQMQHYMHLEKKYNSKRKKINAKNNKLMQKNSKLHRQKPSKKKKQKKNKNKAKTSFKEKMKKAGQAIKKVAVDFVKFAFKFFGSLLAPFMIIVILFLIIMMTLDGTAENNTYVLGTYNCNDYTIAQCIERYTKIANDFNNTLIKCQSSDSWRRGLSDFGINSSSYDDTPKDFVFGKSSYFNYEPVYDYDAYKLIAFMCAYNYDFSKDNSDVENWEYDEDTDDDTLEDLFYAEYKFEHQYVNASKWQILNAMKPYPSDDSYLIVADAGTTTVNKKTYGFIKFDGDDIYAVPEELQDFTPDNSIHFDLSTGEIKDRMKKYGKTGFYVQNVNKEYTLNSSKLDAFYTYYTDSKTNESYFGFTKDNKLYKKSQLYVNNKEFNYAVSDTDLSIYTNNAYKNKKAVRYFQQEKYVTECKLYTNVKRVRTFDEAIKYLLKKQKNSNDRIEFYNTLANSTNKDTYGYGNHQMYQCPVNNTLTYLSEHNKVYNNYGYDIQEWNNRHCSLNFHSGMDIVAGQGTKVKAMIAGEIDDIDTDSHTLILKTKDDLDYWYDDHYKTDTKITYTNINPSVKEGDIVKAGAVIGTVDTYEHCYDDVENPNTKKNYLHITVEIYYGWWTRWETVDPQFLIYRD
jgi:murein DD-endopeptidase MepM/ murein hydrolase activator NlpD